MEINLQLKINFQGEKENKRPMDIFLMIKIIFVRRCKGQEGKKAILRIIFRVIEIIFKLSSRLLQSKIVLIPPHSCKNFYCKKFFFFLFSFKPSFNKIHFFITLKIFNQRKQKIYLRSKKLIKFNFVFLTVQTQNS